MRPTRQLLYSEQLTQLQHGVLRAGHPVSHRPAVRIYLVIIAARLRPVAKEVDLLEVLLDKLEAVALVPALGKGVDRDLTADDKAEAAIAELTFQRRLEGGPHAVNGVVGGESVPLGLAAAPAHRTQVDEARAELDKGAALDRKHEIGHVAQGEIDEALRLRLAQMGGDVLLMEEDAAPASHEAVLGEDILEVVQDAGTFQLFGNFVVVGSADDGEGGVLGRPRQERLHGVADQLARECQRSVHVEQAEELPSRCHRFLVRLGGGQVNVENNF